MQYRFKLATIVMLGICSSSVTLAEESTLKEGAKKVGQETGEVVHKIGATGKEVGKKVAEVAVDVGHAARDGAKEFAKAVKSGPDNEAASSSASSAVPAHKHK
ncbi:MAG: hypothetical protein AB7F79_00615 [Steroidobacteraceae bacterium]